MGILQKDKDGKKGGLLNRINPFKKKDSNNLEVPKKKEELKSEFDDDFDNLSAPMEYNRERVSKFLFLNLIERLSSKVPHT